MASSIIGTAADLGRKVVDRYSTVVGDDWEARRASALYPVSEMWDCRMYAC